MMTLEDYADDDDDGDDDDIEKLIPRGGRVSSPGTVPHSCGFTCPTRHRDDDDHDDHDENQDDYEDDDGDGDGIINDSTIIALE